MRLIKCLQINFVEDRTERENKNKGSVKVVGGSESVEVTESVFF
jgi:hypothetical protein